MAGQILGGQGILSNPLIATLSPDQQQNLVQLQQRQAIGQALLGQGLQPLDTGNAQVGGMAYHVSPLNGFAKLLQAYVGNKLSMDSMGQQAGLMSQMVGKPFLGGDNTQAQSTDSGGGPTVSLPPSSANDTAPMQGVSAGLGLNTPTPIQLGQAMGGQQPAAHYGPMTLPGKTPQESMQIFAMVGPDAYSRMLTQWAAPTDATRMAQQGGLDATQANRDALFKSNFVAPITGTGIFRDPRTMQPTAYNPNIPDGSTPLFDASGNVAQVSPITGAQGVMQGNAAATAAGGAQFKPVQVYNPATHQMEFSNEASVTNPATPAPIRNNNPGAMMPGGKLAQYPDMQTGLQALDQNLLSYGKQGVNTVSGVISKWAPPNENDTQAYIKDVSQRLGISPGQKIDLSNPLVRQSLSTAIALHENGSAGVFGGGATPQGGAPAAAPPLGVQAGATTGATNQQNELSTKWTALNAQNQQAQSVISNLQNIKDLAGKAVTGPQSDRLNFVNGLLSLAGSDRASNMVDANALLDKNSNQIIAKLGQGGMGTDAARSILQSAYPNTHMQPGAINEAADNLIGLQQMVQAKAKLLAPLRNANDVTGYTNKELAFDQNADPRIWQMQGMNPSQQKAYVSALPPTVAAQLLKQRGALKGMGAL